MNRYTVTLSSDAERALKHLDKPLRRRVRDRLRELAENPRPQGCTKLRGYENRWRVRVGDYRILYTIEDGVVLRVLVVEIEHRREVYRH